jgi:hypothetical protein
MKTKLSVLLLILSISAGLSTLGAQEMVPAMKNLQKFVGNWNCADTKAVMGGKTYTLSYDVKCTSAIDGMGLYMEEHFKHEELGTLKGLDIVGYDPNLKMVHMYTIDNMGTCHDHLGTWQDNEHIFFQYSGIVEGKLYVEKIYFAFMGTDRMNFKLVGEHDGVVQEEMSGVFRKK